MKNPLQQYAFDSGVKKEALDKKNAVLNNLMATNLVAGYDDVRGAPRNPHAKGMVFARDALGRPVKDVFLASNDAEFHQIVDRVFKTIDADTYTYGITSAGVPSVLTTVWTTTAIEQLYQTTPYFKVTTPFQQGAFGTTNIIIPSFTRISKVQQYDDVSGASNNSLNINYIDTQTVTLQLVNTFGDLDVARTGMAKIDLISQLRTGLMEQINLTFNTIGFYGYQGTASTVGPIRLFGLLNSPYLRGNLTAPAGASGSSLWSTKTFLEITADWITNFSYCQSYSGGRLNNDTKFFAILPPAVMQSLNTLNDLGTVSVYDWVKKTYPNCEIVQSVQHQGTGDPIGSTTPNYFQIIIPELGGQPTVYNSFVTMYNSHGQTRELSYFNEKASFVPGSCIPTRQTAISIMEDI